MSPDSLGFCSGCGYCRSLEEGKEKLRDHTTPAGSARFLGLPVWVWLLVLGLLMLVLGVLLAPRFLPTGALVRHW